MPKKMIPVVKPLKVPEPCVIDELPEVVTVVDGLGVIQCGHTATLAERANHDIFEINSCRWCCISDNMENCHIAAAIRYVAGVE